MKITNLEQDLLWGARLSGRWKNRKKTSWSSEAMMDDIKTDKDKQSMAGTLREPNMYYGVRWERRKHWENQTSIIVFANHSHENYKSRTILFFFFILGRSSPLLGCEMRNTKISPFTRWELFSEIKKTKTKNQTRRREGLLSVSYQLNFLTTHQIIKLIHGISSFFFPSS